MVTAPTYSAKDGTFRRIEIRTDQKDFKVRRERAIMPSPRPSDGSVTQWVSQWFTSEIRTKV